MDIDILDAQTWDEGMFERLRWLRENDPVHWDEKNRLWVLSRYEEVTYVSKHPKLFCSGEGVRPTLPVKISIIDMDEPRHGRMRRLVSPGFMPRMVEKLEVPFRRITIEAINRVVEHGTCDFVTDISVPMPIELIAELMGIPKADRARLHRWSDAMMAGDENYRNHAVMEEAGIAFTEYVEYLKATIEARRRDPRDDLVSVLVQARDEGLLGSTADEVAADAVAKIGSEERLAMATDELTMFLVILLVAGNETTRNAISGGMSQLIENPGERQKLIDDPSLIPTAVEEIVRYVSPVLNFARTATQDAELRGKRIKKGQKVLLLYPSANRDPDVFEDPDAFKVDRDPNPHVGFGIGNHYCLGANLARLEIRVVVEEVLRRMPDMEYTAGPPTMCPSTLVRSFVHMPVRFTPAGVDGATAAAV